MLRKLVIALLLAAALLLPASAAEPVGYVALTFDDGPSGAITTHLLQELAHRRVRATFFLCGYRIDQYPQAAQAIAAAGHELGIHGQTHQFLPGLPPQSLRAELQAAAQRIEAVCGVKPRLLRPPGGLTDEAVCAAAREAALPIILWSVDPEDWCSTDSDGIARRILAQVRPGSVILMHELSMASVEAAAQVIDTLQNRGYSFVTVSELATLYHTALNGGEQYFCFTP